ncbi:MAG: 4Fe-4S dicluster domain-containing protein [Desulfobacterales bacterium]|nr:4Fe-4S dicluster domain-containing protein [Desulfobacterales bacterium]
MAFTITPACIGCRACAGICPTRAITGQKKSRHAIDPAICIECRACGRVCPSGAVTDNFGLAVKRIPKKRWERPWFNTDLCMSCTICIDTCPAGVIGQVLQKVGSTHKLPFLENEAGCIACGFCAQDCPVEAITMGPRPSATKPAPAPKNTEPEKAEA